MMASIVQAIAENQAHKLKEKYMNTDILKELRNLDKNDILKALGLETQRNSSEMVLPVLGIFIAGAITGLAAGLLVAPKSGEQLRADMMGTAEEARDQVKQKADSAKDYAKDAAHKVSEKVAD